MIEQMVSWTIQELREGISASSEKKNSLYSRQVSKMNGSVAWSVRGIWQGADRRSRVCREVFVELRRSHAEWLRPSEGDGL